MNTLFLEFGENGFQFFEHEFEFGDPAGVVGAGQAVFDSRDAAFEFMELPATTAIVLTASIELLGSAMIKALKDVNFPADGALSLEFEGNPDDPIAEIKKCIAVAAEAAQLVTSHNRRR